MKRNVDAVVIGAGVIGSGVAYELAKRGLSIVVIDKATGPGLGSTSSSSAVIRFNYLTFDSVALAWESFHQWINWQGYLSAPDEEPLAKLVNVGVAMLEVPLVSSVITADLFKRVGVPHEIWTSTELGKRIPGIDTGKYWPPKRIDDDQFWEDATDTLGAIYTPEGGYINDPLLATENLANAARRAGATMIFKAEVVKILKANGRISGVRLRNGTEIMTSVVVNVAGPWSSKINALAGAGSDFTLTVRPMRQEVHHVSVPSIFSSAPVIGDLDLGTYMRSTPGNGLLVGGTEPECEPFEWVDDPDSANLVRTQALFESQVTRAARRLPTLRIPSTASGIAGVYDVSSDWSPIYDASDVPGFYLAIGTSGNQFKNAPVVGAMMAELITQVENGVDHDANPVHFQGIRTGHVINLATFSRKRKRNENSTGTVMG